MGEVEDVLAHFGVRGMHWGVRKKETRAPVSISSKDAPTAWVQRSKTGPAEGIVVKVKPGQSLKTKGGKGYPPTNEAIIAAALRQRAKASGRQSLSNQDLRVVIDRMNLEQNYSKLNPRKLTFGQKATEELLYGSTPKMALESVKVIAATDPKTGAFINPRTAKGVAIAGAIIANRPKKPGKK